MQEHVLFVDCRVTSDSLEITPLDDRIGFQATENGNIAWVELSYLSAFRLAEALKKGCAAAGLAPPIASADSTAHIRPLGARVDSPAAGGCSPVARIAALEGRADNQRALQQSDAAAIMRLEGVVSALKETLDEMRDILDAKVEAPTAQIEKLKQELDDERHNRLEADKRLYQRITDLGRAVYV